MLGILKKKKDSSAPAAPGKAASVEARDFIPQFSHFNAHTVITKNGEVMQTLRIDANKNGLNYEPHDSTGKNLRECVRKAMVQHVVSDNVSLWIHTVRRRKNVSFTSHYDNPFATYVNNAWRARHGWSHQYYNEVYLTLLYEGQNSKLTDKRLAKEGATVKKNRALRNTYIESATAELDLMMDSIADDLSVNYRVHRLAVVERIPSSPQGLPLAPMFYSEPMEFLGYLLNLRADEHPLPDADMSAALQSCDLLFGFNAMETKSVEGVKRFGAVLSLKQYREVPSHTVDMLLQAPMELVISQAFHFIPSDMALKEYREQKDYFDMSGDTYSMQASGLAEMLQANKNVPTDFGSQQTSIMVLVDELKKLDEDIGQLQTAFSGLGLVCIREDIRLEEIFWSMFPGNFNFLRRKTAIPTARIGGFAKLNRFAGGRSEETFWKEPVALLPTLVNSPYFFNFHVQDNGHTLWVDFNSFGDRMAYKALSFLLTQSHKLQPRVFYFDYQQSAHLWFSKMGTDYHVLHTNSKQRSFAINPFSLEGDARNIGFLSAWCADLIGATGDERASIKQAIEQFYASGAPAHLPGFVEALRSAAPELAARFSPWLEQGQYGGLFSAASDDCGFAHDWLAVDLTEAMETAQNAVAAFAYLLHRVVLSLDGRATIIVLHHAVPILQQPFFASRLSSLLEMLKENNAMIIFHARYSETLPGNPIMPVLLESCASKIISPDDLNLEYTTLFPALLDADDQALLWSMNRMQGDVMVKQGAETVAIRINLDAMPDVAAIFDNDVKTLISAGGAFSGLPRKVS